MANSWTVVSQTPAQSEKWNAVPQQTTKPTATSNFLNKTGELISNIGPSAYNLGAGVANMVMHPLDTAGQIGDIASGELMKASRAAHPEGFGKIMGPLTPEARAALPSGEQQVQAANAFNKSLYERHGGSNLNEVLQHNLNTLVTDPVGMAAEIAPATRFAGRTVARVPKLGAVGGAIEKVGTYTDPLVMAGKGLPLLPTAAGKLVTGVLGNNTGMGQRAVEIAFEAGKKGKAYGQAFLDNMRKDILPEDVVNMANTAVSNLRGLGIAAYNRMKSGPGGWATKPDALDFSPVDKVIENNAFAGYGSNGKILKNPDAANTFQEIKKIIDEHREAGKADPETYFSAEGLDDLKQKINNMKYTSTGDLNKIAGPGRGGERVVNDVTNALRDIIKEKHPEYAQAMEQSENALGVLDEMNRTLHLTGGKVLPDKALRSLQKILRDDASTNYGQVARLGDQLVEAGAPNLLPALAGQSARSWRPRGVASAGGTSLTSAAGYLAGGLPGAAASVLSSIPRLVGEGAYAAGAVARYPARLAEALKSMPGASQAAKLASIAKGKGYVAQLAAMELQNARDEQNKLAANQQRPNYEDFK